MSIREIFVLTAFGPYTLNVKTNISSYGPRAQLIRTYSLMIKMYHLETLDNGSTCRLAPPLLGSKR